MMRTLMTQKLKVVIIQLKKTLDLYCGVLVIKEVISFRGLKSPELDETVLEHIKESNNGIEKKCFFRIFLE